MKEWNTDSIEMLFEKLKSKEITKENKIEKVQEVLHKEIDGLKTEKDFERFCLKMGECVFNHYRDLIKEK